MMMVCRGEDGTPGRWFLIWWFESSSGYDNLWKLNGTRWVMRGGKAPKDDNWVVRRWSGSIWFWFDGKAVHRERLIKLGIEPRFVLERKQSRIKFRNWTAWQWKKKMVQLVAGNKFHRKAKRVTIVNYFNQHPPVFNQPFCHFPSLWVGFYFTFFYVGMWVRNKKKPGFICMKTI